MTPNERVEFLRKLPNDFCADCVYQFEDQDTPAKGLVKVTCGGVYLKHDNDQYKGSGEKVKPYKFSWYICTHTDGSYCYSDVSVIKLLTLEGKVCIGEL